MGQWGWPSVILQEYWGNVWGSGEGNLLSDLGLGVHSATFAFLRGHVLMPPSLESPLSAPRTLQEGFLCVPLSESPGSADLPPPPLACLSCENRDQDGLFLTTRTRPDRRWAGGALGSDRKEATASCALSGCDLTSLGFGFLICTM